MDMVQKSLLYPYFYQKLNPLSLLIRSNFFVALNAASLVAETFILTGETIRILPVSVVFFSTILVYSFHRLIKISKLNFPDSTENPARYINELKATCLIASAFLIVLLFYSKGDELFFLLPAGLITLGYSVSLFRYSNKYINLRSLPYAKVFIISLMWTLLTVSFPLLKNEIATGYVLIFLERFLFLMAITIPFDIRDMDSDKSEGLKTIPLLAGVDGAKRLSYLLLVVFILLCLVTFISGFHGKQQCLALVLSGGITVFMISRIRTKNPPSFYSFGMEGMSLLQFLLILLSVLIHF